MYYFVFGIIAANGLALFDSMSHVGYIDWPIYVLSVALWWLILYCFSSYNYSLQDPLILM